MLRVLVFVSGLLTISLLVVTAKAQSGLPATRPTGPTTRPVVGQIQKVTEREIILDPPTTSNMVPSVGKLIEISANTTVYSNWLEPSLADRHAGDVTTLKPGQRVAVVTHDGYAESIRVLPPPPVEGVLLAVEDHALTVQPAVTKGAPAPRPERFTLDPEKCVFQEEKPGVARAVSTNVQRLKPQRHVMVLAEEGLAKLIRIAPPPPISGVVLGATERQIVLRPTTRPNQPVVPDQVTFPVSTATRSFISYPGGRNVDTIAADIRPGDTVLVYTDEGRVDAIDIVPRSLRGSLVSINEKQITFRPEAPAKGAASADVVLAVNDQDTQVFLGKLVKTFNHRGGRPMYAAEFRERGKVSDLRAGRYAMVCFRNGVARLIWLTPPIPTTAPSAP